MQKLREAIRTRGFWTSQFIWFLAGLYFTRLIPQQPTEGPWLSVLLQRALIVCILLPIYFSGVLTMADLIDKLINYIVKLLRK